MKWHFKFKKKKLEVLFCFSEPRPRFLSEGSALHTSASAPMPLCVTDHAAREAARRHRPFRDRAMSEPARQIHIQREFGRELRRISDEFHLSYQSLVSITYK